jgi:hypothetical protein
MQGFGLLHTGVYLIICVIESIYLANLTLKMMLTYNDGDIVVKIKLVSSCTMIQGIDSLAYRAVTTSSTIDNFWFT